MKVKTVSDKINDLLHPQVSSDEESNGETRVEDFEPDEYDIPDARSTDFRKQNVKLLSEQSARYKGKLTSRKELRSDDSDDDSDFQQAEDDDESNDNSDLSDSAAEEEEEVYESDNDQEGSEGEESEHEGTTDVISESNRQAEIRKGVCVQNQLRIWEHLLELRIRTQKIVTKANQLPALGDSSYSSSSAQETTEKACNLLKSLLNLKSTLTNQFAEMRNHMKRPLENVSALSDYDSGAPPLKRIADQLERHHNALRSYRNTVLLKWDDRTKLLTPGAGAKKKAHEEFDIVKKIDNALLNSDAMIVKSQRIQNAQPPSSEEVPNGENEESNCEPHVVGNPNIYDDSDFYHQQLRELIEHKANSSSNIAEVTKQYVELQKLRQKMKKKVDTRASKGRKIRYTVHNKLINFMAPDDSTSSNWTDESKNELYKSLFAT